MIVLAACSRCQAQYDVSGHAPKEKLACRCGGTLVVPLPRDEPARMVRCASCGAARQESDQRCSFCGSLFSTVDKGWGLICPRCFCRLPNDARFCVECGVGIAVQKLDALQEDRSCPRCTVPLRARTVDTLTLLECGCCHGIWVPVATFESLLAEKEKAAAAKVIALGQRQTRLKFELTAQEQVKYIPCPVCKSLMNRQNFGQASGVILDVCRDHGVWFDNQELARILQFIESGGLERARKREQEAQEERLRQLANRQRRWALRGGPLPAEPVPLPGLDSPWTQSYPGSVPSDSPLKVVLSVALNLLFHGPRG